MIIISHHRAEELVSVSRNAEELSNFAVDLTQVFWQLCHKFPEDLIIWKEDSVQFEEHNISHIFPHSLIMASHPVANYFIGDEIGYVDQLPFVNPKLEVRYPTWRMSTDVGGIYGKTAQQFEDTFKHIKSFGYLLNSMAKTGQQNSLFCYSDPALVQSKLENKKLPTRNTSVLFSFVGQHYKKVRLLILFFCFLKYERKFPLISLLKALFKTSYFPLNVDLPQPELPESNNIPDSEKIDVIIPTLGRPQHLKNVLFDLRNQQMKPEKVIIVEQNPNSNSSSDLNYLKTEEWPFQIIHHFINQTGACNARNLALKEVKSDLVFFADDDIRFEADMLSKAVTEMRKLNIDALNLNTLQLGEKTEFSKMKQWGVFASGASIVRSKFAKKVSFSLAFEHGFGEDNDYGMKLRKLGCDIIYHSQIILQHLKVASGGFRYVMQDEKIVSSQKPKPSPTFMLLVNRHYNNIMRRGYKVNLFLKFYSRQSVRNPIRYFSVMERRWEISEQKAMELQQQSNSTSR
ncbi:glycosyltransferase family A protein [Christiangramia sp. OXR-203]|uniref:glycosyltransferase family 2 protein n=1 Tax=Christiangramia sp. OXR-203 TaxID=3100176 RepID=UPI002AC8E1C9|nr:glycosyltransferase family A protein [Christiangramia sp. OXR-203]WPY97893.1 glycosyltransferase family A protein [Christiangramia sp. OXR-203]